MYTRIMNYEWLYSGSRLTARPNTNAPQQGTYFAKSSQNIYFVCFYLLFEVIFKNLKSNKLINPEPD